MIQPLVCWKCGASLAALSLPLRRLDACKACNAELHVCRLCVEYDTGVAKHCREPIAEEVCDKERANFCDYFKPRPGAFRPRDETALRASKNALDELFGQPDQTVPGSADTARSEADLARAQLEALFKPDKK